MVWVMNECEDDQFLLEKSAIYAIDLLGKFIPSLYQIADELDRYYIDLATY